MITEYENFCVLCGKPAVNTHHLVFGRGLRKLADEDGLTAPLCITCHDKIHNDGAAGALSKIVGQLQWEKEYVRTHGNDGREREMFRQRYGRSYL